MRGYLHRVEENVRMKFEKGNVSLDISHQSRIKAGEGVLLPVTLDMFRSYSWMKERYKINM